MTMHSRQPAPDTPALDFLRKVQVWQQAPGGTAGIAVLMPDREEATLDQILAEAVKPHADLGWTEAWARNWLIGYKQMNPPLTRDQAAELAAVISRSAALPHAQLRPRPRPQRELRFPPVRHAVLAIIAAIIVIAAGLSVSALLTGSPDSPAVAVPVAAQQPGQQQVPAGYTQLEQFEADWGPFTQLIADPLHPQTGAPALLLLRDGGYYRSAWDLPAGDPGWSPDQSGSITSVTVHGTWALITDADGNQWVVGIGQPFVLAGNPGAVFQVDRAGTVLSTSTAHASTVRTRY